jgi:hypothetical protein
MKLELTQPEAGLLALVHEVAAVNGVRVQHVGFIRALGRKLAEAARQANGAPATLELTEQEFLLVAQKWGALEVGALRWTDAQLEAIESVTTKLREAHEAEQKTEPVASVEE